MTEPGNWRSALGHAVADVVQDSVGQISPEAWARCEPEALGRIIYAAIFRHGIRWGDGAHQPDPRILEAIRGACQWAQQEALGRLDR